MTRPTASAVTRCSIGRRCAWRPTLAHPATGETVRFIAPMAKDMKHLLKELRAQRDNRTLDDGFDDDEDFDDDGVEVIYVRD